MLQHAGFPWVPKARKAQRSGLRGIFRRRQHLMDLVCDLAALDYHIGEMLMAGYFQWH